MRDHRAEASRTVQVADDHHHVVCRRCGRTEDVHHVVGELPCLEPTTSAGFVIDEAEVVFWGLCPGCRSGDHTGPGSDQAPIERDLPVP